MPARSFINQVPEEMRTWLDAQLLERNFAGYADVTDALNAKLAEQGLELQVARSSVHRYGQKFEERVSALKNSTELARTLAREVGDDEGAMTDALTRLVQDKLFHLTLDMEIDPSKVNIYRLGHVIADLGRASLATKKHMISVRTKATEVADSVAKRAEQAGLSVEAIDTIKREILGIADE